MFDFTNTSCDMNTIPYKVLWSLVIVGCLRLAVYTVLALRYQLGRHFKRKNKAQPRAQETIVSTNSRIPLLWKSILIEIPILTGLAVAGITGNLALGVSPLTTQLYLILDLLLVFQLSGERQQQFKLFIMTSIMPIIDKRSLIRVSQVVPIAISVLRIVRILIVECILVRNIQLSNEEDDDVIDATSTAPLVIINNVLAGIDGLLISRYMFVLFRLCSKIEQHTFRTDEKRTQNGEDSESGSFERVTSYSSFSSKPRLSKVETVVTQSENPHLSTLQRIRRNSLAISALYASSGTMYLFACFSFMWQHQSLPYILFCLMYLFGKSHILFSWNNNFRLSKVGPRPSGLFSPIRSALSPKLSVSHMLIRGLSMKQSTRRGSRGVTNMKNSFEAE